MAAKRAPVLAKKKSASSPKPAPKMAKAAGKPATRSAKASAKKPPSAKAAVKKTPSAKAVPKPAPAAKAAQKKAPPPAKKASASNGKKSAAPPLPAPKASATRTSKPAVAKSGGGLAVGDAVPGLDLSDHEGNPFSLSALGGQPYVLYFYPKDDTPGCTREACAFRDDLGKFEGRGVRIIGISPDKPESHARFRTKYGLPFTLLSDADKVAANAFGVWVKKQNYGREYMGIERSTFFVDADGKVKKIWRNVKVDGHAQSVLDAAAS